MPARNVNLTPRLAEFLDRSVASGRFQNASEVVREGLRLLEQRQREDDLKLNALREAVASGLADFEQGRFTEVAPDKVGAYLRELGEE